MRDRQGRVLATLRRVQFFMQARDDVLSTINQGGARRTLDYCIEQLSAHAVTQDARRIAGSGETARKRALRFALRSVCMRPITTIARCRLRTVPEFEALKLPGARIRSIGLVTSARAMAQVAARHQESFVDAGLPTDFIQRLGAAADALEASMTSQNQMRGQRVGATMGLEIWETRGRDAVRVLDTLVLPLILDADDLVAEWKSVKHVDAKPGPSSRPTRPQAEVPALPEPTALPQAA